MPHRQRFFLVPDRTAHLLTDNRLRLQWFPRSTLHHSRQDRQCHPCHIGHRRHSPSLRQDGWLRSALHLYTDPSQTNHIAAMRRFLHFQIHKAYDLKSDRWKTQTGSNRYEWHYQRFSHIHYESPRPECPVRVGRNDCFRIPTRPDSHQHDID